MADEQFATSVCQEDGLPLARGMTFAFERSPTWGSGENHRSDRSSTGRCAGHTSALSGKRTSFHLSDVRTPCSAVSDMRTMHSVGGVYVGELLRLQAPVTVRAARGDLRRLRRRVVRTVSAPAARTSGMMTASGVAIAARVGSPCTGAAHVGHLARRPKRTVSSRPGGHRRCVERPRDDVGHGGATVRVAARPAAVAAWVVREPRGPAPWSSCAARRLRIDQLPSFFVGPALAAGDFGLSRLRYDSPSITRS